MSSQMPMSSGSMGNMHHDMGDHGMGGMGGMGGHDMGGGHSMGGGHDMGGGHSMGGHDMGGMGGMGGMSCSMKMLGNWDTINTCILTSSWRNNTKAKFAGTCIGVAFWVMLTECVRRWAREYDRYIIAQAKRQVQQYEESLLAQNKVDPENGAKQGSRGTFQSLVPGLFTPRAMPAIPGGNGQAATMHRLRPSVFQQIIRAVLYAIQFTSAYLIKLIAMTYNGYLIISIILGALIGYFFATWDTLGSVTLRHATCNPLSVTTREDAGPEETGLWTHGGLAGHAEPQSLATTEVAAADQECHNCQMHTCIS